MVVVASRTTCALVREDLVGSAAHVTMLARTGIVAVADARALRDALLRALDEASRAARSELAASDEEDVHMAVEAELGKRVGAVAARLHTARSRNDQVALDLRLHVRDRRALVGDADDGRSSWRWLDRAAREKDVLLPAYTHRQRAQPVSAAFLVARVGRGARCARPRRSRSRSIGRSRCRSAAAPARGRRSPSTARSSRACSRPCEPPRTRSTPSAIATSRSTGRGPARAPSLALGRASPTDVVDFSTSEFGLVRLDGSIAAGSSMMPQKKNPDVFELVRGKSARRHRQRGRAARRS